MVERQPCILVVDDDPALTRMLEVALRPVAVRVVLSNKSFGVLSLIAREHPAVVVLDVMMPGLDGPSLVELVRGDLELRETKIILWSALDPNELRERARTSGADAYVDKIAGPAAIVSRVRAMLA